MVNDGDWAEARRRAEVLRDLVVAKHRSHSGVRAAARELGISERSVYENLRRLRDAHGDPAGLLPRKPTGGRGKSRLSPETEQLIQNVFAGAASATTGVSGDDLFHQILDQCRTSDIPEPSRSTVRRRFDAAKAAAGPSTPHPTPDVIPVLPHPSAWPGASHAGALLDCLYDSVISRDGWASFLEALARDYAGGMAALYVHDTTVRQGFAYAGGLFADEALAKYNEYYSRINPWLSNIGKRRIGVAVAAEFMLPRSDLVRTEFYNDWLRPQGLASGVSASIQHDENRVMAVSVLFPAATRERDHDAIGRLQYLVPHLLRVAQLKRQLTGLEARAANAEAVLNRLSVGVVVIGSNRQIVYLNSMAETILATRDGIVLMQNSLLPGASSDRTRFGLMVESALRSRSIAELPPGGMMRLNRPSGRMSYEVLISPVGSDTLGSGFQGAGAVVFIRDPELVATSPVQRLRQLYALTEAEARVMHGIIGGETLTEIAVNSGKRLETIRSQLKSVFRKTGTDRQVELIRQGIGSLHVVAR
jgi:DNA-binding CsgD family transcriptional regulator/molybdenum-dependent DNA-binding transcriptional regulator ModE